VQYESHVDELVQPGVDISGDPSFTPTSKEPGAIDPIDDDRPREQPASNLPFNEIDECADSASPVQRVSADVPDRVDDTHVRQP
jgi:hypothetical protein